MRRISLYLFLVVAPLLMEGGLEREYTRSSRNDPITKELDAEDLRVVSPIRQRIASITPESLELQLRFESEDFKGLRSQTFVNKTISWEQYAPLGTYCLQKKGSRLEFVEGATKYTLKLPSERTCSELFGRLHSLRRNAQKHLQEADLPTPSQLFRDAGFSHVLHTTRPENLEAIIKSGKLQSGNEVASPLYGDPIGNHTKLFMSVVENDPTRKKTLAFVSNRLPVLLFSMDPIVDKYRFHISSGYPYGRFIRVRSAKHKIFPSAASSDAHALQNFVNTPHNRLANELVIQGNVSLEHLERILVAKGKKKSWVDCLGLEWENRIEEVDLLYADKLPNEPPHPLLHPYSKNSHAIVIANLHQRLLSGREIMELLMREYPQLLTLIEPQWDKIRELVKEADDDCNQGRLDTILRCLGPGMPPLSHFGYNQKPSSTGV